MVCSVPDAVLINLCISGFTIILSRGILFSSLQMKKWRHTVVDLSRVTHLVSEEAKNPNLSTANALVLRCGIILLPFKSWHHANPSIYTFGVTSKVLH